MEWADDTDLYPADKGELVNFEVRIEELAGTGFFFLFKIKCEDKEEETDGFVGHSLQATLKEAMTAKVVFLGDLHAMVADDLLHFFFHLCSKGVIAHIHIQFNTGVGTDPVDIIGAVGHPHAIIGGHLTM